MSQKDEQDIKDAVAKAALEWDRLDATLYSDLPQGKKLAVLSHLRRVNSKTGLQWAGAAYHAKAMSVSTQQAERTMRELRKDGVLQEVNRKNGGTVTVKLAPSWLETSERCYLKWKTERRLGTPRLPTPGVSTAGVDPSLPQPHPPAVEGPTPRPPTAPYPSRHPAKDATDLSRPSVGSASLPSFPQVDLADDSYLPKKEEGPGLQMQEPGVVVLDGSVPWVAPPEVQPSFRPALHFNAKLGKLSFAANGAGRALYQSLRDDGYGPEIIRGAMIECGDKAAKSRLSPGALAGLLRKYCGYGVGKIEEKRQRSQIFEKPKAFRI